jgi:hypothetical protein
VMMDEFCVYKRDSGRATRLPAFLGVRAEQRDPGRPMISHATAASQSATSNSTLSFNINYTNMGDHLPCESALPSCCKSPY